MGVQKTIIEIKLPPNQAYPDHLMYDLLFGVMAAGMKERFDISVFKTDDNYIYLDIKPCADKDRREFTQIRLALYGPGEATAKYAYLPAQVYVVRPGGDSEVWKFRNPQVNLPGVSAANFAFVPVKGWSGPPPSKPK